MIKILFVCHGNICRSPMAEYLFKRMIKLMDREDDFLISSCATSNEEIGNPVHPGTRRILNSLGIDCSDKRARRMNVSDYNIYDYIIAMDENNIRNINRIIGHDSKNKVHLLLDFVGLNRDISDPWYTGDFKATYDDIMLGLNGFIEYLGLK